MSKSFTVQMGEEEFNIVSSDGDASATVEYGAEPACLSIDGEIFYCEIGDPDEANPVVKKVDSFSRCPTVAVEVEFEDEEEEEELGPVLVEETEDAG